MVQNFLYVDGILSGKFILNKQWWWLSEACYAKRSVKPSMSQETLEMVDYASFHSILNCGLIFLGKSSHNAKIFKIQKNIISVIEGYRRRDSCIDLFKNNFLNLHPQYTLSIHPYLLTYRGVLISP